MSDLIKLVSIILASYCRSCLLSTPLHSSQLGLRVSSLYELKQASPLNVLSEGSVLNDNTASSHKSNKPSSMDCGPNEREEDNDVVEAHCYFVNIGLTDREQIHSRCNNDDCRMFWPCRPLSTAYKTVLYAVDKGLCGQNILQTLLLILPHICSRSVRARTEQVLSYLGLSKSN